MESENIVVNGSGIEVEKWLFKGEFSGDAKTNMDILDEAGALLDDSCSNEICGPALFVGKDGKTYTVEIQAVIVEADPDYIEAIMEGTKGE